MKITIQPGQQPIFQYTCDRCGESACGYLRFSFGYGSDHDLQEMRLDLCNRHSEELLSILQEKYPTIELQEISIS